MPAYAVTTLEQIPRLGEGDVDWRPIQHYFQLTAFGINTYRAAAAGVELIEEHDEIGGRHEEVYVVLDGAVTFTVAGETFRCTKGGVVVVKDPAVRRQAVAETADALVLAVGNREADRFESTWNPRHFEAAPTYDG